VAPKDRRQVYGVEMDRRVQNSGIETITRCRGFMKSKNRLYGSRFGHTDLVRSEFQRISVSYSVSVRAEGGASISSSRACRHNSNWRVTAARFPIAA
jgi:hypothetical protein